MSSKVPWMKAGTGDDHGISVEAAVAVDRGGNGGLRVSEIHLGFWLPFGA
jgi:hypothetical protein